MSDQPDTPLAQWAADLTAAVNGLEIAGDLERFRSIPTGGAPDDRLRDLAALWEALGLPKDDNSSFGTVRLAEFEQQALAKAQAEAVSFRRLVGALAEALGEAVQQASDPVALGFIDPDCFTKFYTADAGKPGQPVIVLIGLVDTLPDEHPLRAALAGEDLARSPTGRPLLVLGAARPGTSEPRPWYTLAGARALTRSTRQRQALAAEQKQALEAMFSGGSKDRS